MENVYIAPKGYRVQMLNPFTPDGGYDRSWTLLTIDPQMECEVFNGKAENGCYSVALSPRYGHFRYRLADFLQYETAHGRKVILVAEEAPDLAFDSHYRERTVRPCDPPLLVHSTTLDAYVGIRRDGCLKSLSMLRSEGTAVHPVGLAPLGEPEDYLDYVMFAEGGLAPEFVVSARQHGVIRCDPDAPYAPQARLYFDGHRLVRDGRVTRDLTSKVYGHVPLDPYLLCVVTAADVPLPEGQREWTPRAFAGAADAYARDRIPLD